MPDCGVLKANLATEPQSGCLRQVRRKQWGKGGSTILPHSNNMYTTVTSSAASCDWPVWLAVSSGLGCLRTAAGGIAPVSRAVSSVSAQRRNLPRQKCLVVARSPAETQRRDELKQTGRNDFLTHSRGRQRVGPCTNDLYNPNNVFPVGMNPWDINQRKRPIWIRL